MKFSKVEIKDLVKAWIVISVVCVIAFGNLKHDFFSSLLKFAITVGFAFLLHELGHKFVAQHYHYKAEFRANNTMLFLAVMLSFTGIIFAAPGAVMISGHITRGRFGKIAAAGPLVNIILSIIFLPLAYFFKHDLLIIGAQINAFIALFNMLPFGMFDGKKIIRWSKPIFTVMVIASFVLLIGSAILRI